MKFLDSNTMRTAQCCLDATVWGDEDPEATSVWGFLYREAVFHHKDACEFIVHAPSLIKSHGQHIPEPLQPIITEADTYKLDYVCFYA